MNLSTHIQDVVAFLCTENLSDVSLLGHSYGGLVITGSAAKQPKRIAQLIYLDAFGHIVAWDIPDEVEWVGVPVDVIQNGNGTKAMLLPRAGVDYFGLD